MAQSKKNFKSSKGKTKKFTKNFKSDVKENFLNTDNDVSWYTKYPSLVTAASTLIFNERYGYSYPVIDNFNADAFNGNENSVEPEVTKHSVVGAVNIHYLPWVGSKGTAAEAINVAAKNLYTFVRHANSGSANYESSDLMQYVVMVGSLFSFAEYLKRELRLVLSYKATNLFAFKAFFEDEYKYELLIQNHAQYVSRLNILIAKLNTFKIPKDISFIQRWKWLNSNIFKDDNLDKCSYYRYVPNYLYNYRWADQEVDLNDQNYCTVGSNFEQELGMLNDQIDNLLAYEDVGIMIGDILKAYKNEGCDILTPMQIGEIIEPTYSIEALQQIKNVVSVGENTMDEFVLSQVSDDSQLLATTAAGLSADYNGCYICAPINNTDYQDILNDVIKVNPILSIDSDNPSAEELIVQTRLSYQVEIDPHNGYVVRDCGTEVVQTIAYALYTGTPTETGLHHKYVDQTIMFLKLDSRFSPADDSDYISGIIQTLMVTESISYFPQLTTIVSTGSFSDSDIFIDVFNRFYGKNVKVIEPTWLKLLHDGCKLSEFTMPMFKLLEVQ